MKHVIFVYLFISFFNTLLPNSFEELLIGTPQKNLTNYPSCHAITFKVENWRRLGDVITTFGKAAYFRYVLPKLTLYYRPFAYCDQFQLSQKERVLTPEIEKQFFKTIIVNSIEDITKNLASALPILFECHFLTQTPWLYTFSRQYISFEKELKTLFTPLEPINPLPKPEGVITVAVHVRKGGGFDRPLLSKQEYDLDTNKPVKGFYLFKNSPGNSCTDIWPIKWPAGKQFNEEIKKLVSIKNNFSDYIWPIKFPPDQYYIDQIKHLGQILPNKNLLIYLFTDDANPEAIIQRYSKALEDFPRIIFSYRQKENHHTKNVLNDLFAMAQCDCLISASSSFAFIAQIVGDHSIIIFPAHAITLPDKIIINKVGVITVNNALDSNKRTLSYDEIKYKLR